MSLILPDGLPAIESLKEENIFIENCTQTENRSTRKLRIALLNIMPIKETTEMDFARVLSYSPLNIELTLMKLRTHTPKHASPEHMERFYTYFDELKDEKFDGFIVTGAPIEHLEFEDVSYWKELSEIFAWADTNVKSTLYICWAAQAGLYYHYGVPKYTLDKKMFGVFSQKTLQPHLPIYRGFDDFFFMPQSRHTEVRKEDILANKDLQLIAESDESGVGMVMARNGREFFVTGHMEYSSMTLDKEYRRDYGKRSDVEMPKHYYADDDMERGPVVRWRAHANLFFNNWINYYVYQETPYDINKIG